MMFSLRLLQCFLVREQHYFVFVAGAVEGDEGMHCSFFLWPFVLDDSLKYQSTVFWSQKGLSSIRGTREALLTGSYTHPLSTKVEKRCFCFHFCNSYLMETWISADGILTNWGWKHFIRHVSASVESQKHIPYTRVSVSSTLAETLTNVMFPQPVNSEDAQLSVEFLEQWMRKLNHSWWIIHWIS